MGTWKDEIAGALSVIPNAADVVSLMIGCGTAWMDECLWLQEQGISFTGAYEMYVGARGIDTSSLRYLAGNLAASLVVGLFTDGAGAASGAERAGVTVAERAGVPITGRAGVTVTGRVLRAVGKELREEAPNDARAVVRGGAGAARGGVSKFFDDIVRAADRDPGSMPKDTLPHGKPPAAEPRPAAPKPENPGGSSPRASRPAKSAPRAPRSPAAAPATHPPVPRPRPPATAPRP